MLLALLLVCITEKVWDSWNEHFAFKRPHRRDYIIYADPHYRYAEEDAEWLRRQTEEVDEAITICLHPKQTAVIICNH